MTTMSLRPAPTCRSPTTRRPRRRSQSAVACNPSPFQWILALKSRIDGARRGLQRVKARAKIQISPIYRFSRWVAHLLVCYKIISSLQKVLSALVASSLLFVFHNLLCLYARAYVCHCAHICAARCVGQSAVSRRAWGNELVSDEWCTGSAETPIHAGIPEPQSRVPNLAHLPLDRAVPRDFFPFFLPSFFHLSSFEKKGSRRRSGTLEWLL